MKQNTPGMGMQSIQSDIAPEELRERALQRLLDLTSSDGVAFQLRVQDCELFYTGLCATADVRPYARALDGQRHLDGSVTPKDQQASAVRSPHDNATAGFLRFNEDRDLRPWFESQVWQEFYQPFEITDHLRTMFYAEGELIGYLAALKRGGDRFTVAEKYAANRLIPEIYDDFQLAWSAERALRDDHSLHLILDERWNVIFASQSARIWLTARRRELLRTLGKSRERRLIDGMHVATTRLESCPGGLFYASLSLAAPVRKARWEELSENQQRIVDMATKGFTNAEIGRTLGISPATVKYHLNAAFNHLGVRSRTELVNSASTIDTSLWIGNTCR